MGRECEKMEFLCLYSWSSAGEQLSRTFIPRLTENIKAPAFSTSAPERFCCPHLHCLQQHTLNTSIIFQKHVPENDTTLNTEKKTFRCLVCLPVSQLAEMMVYSNYCHISWAKGGRSKCLINSCFPMGAINDIVR